MDINITLDIAQLIFTIAGGIYALFLPSIKSMIFHS
jgi:hypothetical protein